jgi:hypothetical protein
MRETRQSGSEGGARFNPCPYPYPAVASSFDFLFFLFSWVTTGASLTR